MLDVIFLKVLSFGIELGVMVLCLLPLRWILRKMFPRLFSYLLWCAIPVDIAYNVCVRIVKIRVSYVGNCIPKIIPWELETSFFAMLKNIWIFGSGLVLLVTIVSYICFRKRLIGSIRLHENIYVTDRITSPFSMGLVFPKIYLPYTLEKEYYPPVVLHEKVHIARKDIWVKYVAMGLLMVFWFQPLLWLAYYLFVNDMEEACDEAVLRKREGSFRNEYAKALVEVSYQAGRVPGVAIGYGNGEIKARIQNVLKYKKAGIKMCFAAVVMCILVICSTIFLSLQCPQLVQIEPNQNVEVKNLSVQVRNGSVKELSDLK